MPHTHTHSHTHTLTHSLTHSHSLTGSYRMSSSWKWMLALPLLLPVPWMALAEVVPGLIWNEIHMRLKKTAPMQWAARMIEIPFRALGREMLKDERNFTYLYTLFGIGILVPAMFAGVAYYTAVYGFDIRVVLVYSIIKMGPYLMWMALVSTLIHKVQNRMTYMLVHVRVLTVAVVTCLSVVLLCSFLDSERIATRVLACKRVNIKNLVDNTQY